MTFDVPVSKDGKIGFYPAGLTYADLGSIGGFMTCL